ncbi:GrpB family protein [Paenibacillus sp.]|uniref:GrpB family protein n=1 Tax=Paenibacillus sp. TaxID=58172 RepID=UPI0028117441|nr:GrpB family protein [Paenibacillus sp.]
MSESKPYAVAVVPYNTVWPAAFEAERERLLAMLAPNVSRIEHVGSTSVPGQAAKPILDLFAAARPLLSEAEYAERLREAGYAYQKTGMVGRHLFYREAGTGARTHHLHLLPEEGFYERNEILLRDYLRAHPAEVEAYGALKRELAKRYAADPDGYTRAKTSFIQRIVDAARTERGLPLESVWEE